MEPYGGNLPHKSIFDFRNPDLLEEALTHSTFVEENAGLSCRSNERLEFLGDAVLGLITSMILMEIFPEEDEGVLTKFRAHLVNRTQLAMIARELGLGERLRLGKGEEKTGGRDKETILADTLEALIGAMFIDRGLEDSIESIRELLSRPISELKKGKTKLDAKSLLQEKAQALYGVVPDYKLVREYGPPHRKSFLTRVKIGRKIMGEGTGRSKKESQQRAAEMALENILSGMK